MKTILILLLLFLPCPHDAASTQIPDDKANASLELEVNSFIQFIDGTLGRSVENVRHDHDKQCREGGSDCRQVRMFGKMQTAERLCTEIGAKNEVLNDSASQFQFFEQINGAMQASRKIHPGDLMPSKKPNGNAILQENKLPKRLENASKRIRCELQSDHMSVDSCFVIDGASIVDPVNDTLLENRRIIIVNERIVVVGPSEEVDVPVGATIVDGRQKFVVPGLWDCHIHLRTAGQESLLELVEHGVIFVRDMGGNLETLDWLFKESRCAPEVLRSGPFVDGPIDMEPWRRVATVTLWQIDQVHPAIVKLRGKGVDFIKIHNGLSKDIFYEIVKSAKEIGLRVDAHLTIDVAARDAASAGIRTFEHLNALIENVINNHDEAGSLIEAVAFLKSDDGKALFEHFGSSQMAFTPTLESIRGFLNESLSSEKQSKAMVEDYWKNLLQIVALAHRSGVTLLAGSDLFHEQVVTRGVALHHELRHLVAAGLTPAEAICCATVNPAKTFEREKEYGKIIPGFVASLMIVDENPLEDIRNLSSISTVFVRGNIFRPREIQPPK